MTRTPGLLPLPPSIPALRAELERLDAEIARKRTRSQATRRLLAIERRRVVVRIDLLEGSAIA